MPRTNLFIAVDNDDAYRLEERAKVLVCEARLHDH